jgi:hypothetical protein
MRIENNKNSTLEFTSDQKRYISRFDIIYFINNNFETNDEFFIVNEDDLFILFLSDSITAFPDKCFGSNEIQKSLSFQSLQKFYLYESINNVGNSCFRYCPTL